MRYAYLTHADLRQSWIRYAQLQGAWFSESLPQGADFPYSRLKNADFSPAHLEGASFWHSDLTRARFDGTYLCDVDLRNTKDLTRGQLKNAILNPQTPLPRKLDTSAKVQKRGNRERKVDTTDRA